jgi:hypothetical protein
VALACRRIHVQYEEFHVKPAQRVGGVDLGLQTSDLYKTWESFETGGPVADIIVRDGTLVMKKEDFEIFCQQNRRNNYKSLSDIENDDDGDVLEQDPLKGAELGIL